MTKRTDARNISLGPAHAEREAALRTLATALGLDGNLSAVVRFVADCVGDNPDALANFLEAAAVHARTGNPWHVYAVLRQYLPPMTMEPRDPMVRGAAGQIVAVRLYDDDGRPLGLADAAQANPKEYQEFAEFLGTDEDE